jgi:serine/threonine-protein kinase HipA
MTILGEGRSPGREHCLALARQTGIKPKEAEVAIERVYDALAHWLSIADQAGCTRVRAREIARSHRRLGKPVNRAGSSS